jgi:SAM-dependent methyltransferase
MNQFGDLYSQYYDLLYQDKDYHGEVKYIESLINKYNLQPKTLLDMGCGTGKHAELFCEKGYTVHGIDLSADMLKIAEQRIKNQERLTFTQSDIVELDLEKQFSVVVSLFHVISYQNSNEDLIKTFEVAKKHLNDDGIFIFDFWYGPAVLTDLPNTRIKRLEDNNIKVTRIAESDIDAQKNVVYVNYDVFIENKKTSEVIEKKELHKMRYLFDTELEIICKKIGFRIEKKLKWMSKKTPNFNSWNVVWIVRKI